MKIYIYLIFLFGSTFVSAQKQSDFEKRVADSLKEQLLGNWYMTGIYSFDINAKYDYLSAPNGSFGLKITTDSIQFIEPPTRFYKRTDDQFRYIVSFEDHYQGQTIDLFRSKSKKETPRQLHFEMNGDELILTEELESIGFSELKVTRQYSFNRYFDPLQLETKLQYTWSTNDIKELDLSKASDTIIFDKTLNSVELKQYNLKIYREPGWFLKTKIELFQHSENEGVLIRETGNIILHPKNQEIEIISSQGTWFFKVLSIDDEQLILVRQNK